jgi:hypothetical protein
MTPEERLEEARRQIGLARESSTVHHIADRALERAQEDVRLATAAIEMARDETADAEVVE